MHSLGLDEQFELTDEQLFLLHNHPTDNDPYFSPDNLLTPSPVNVKTLLQNWNCTNRYGTFDYPNAVLKYYAETLTLPEPNLDYTLILDNIDDWPLRKFLEFYKFPLKHSHFFLFLHHFIFCLFGING